MIESNTFAEACYDTNSIYELRQALLSAADENDMESWGLSESEWYSQIQLALNELINETI